MDETETWNMTTQNLVPGLKKGNPSLTKTIALAGKGGTGKTTISALLIRHLMEKQNGSILAIDADPASNLPMVLGIEAEGNRKARCPAG